MIDEQERQGSGVKRKFNALVENEMVEDYSLRYAPRSFRKWSEYACATAALGGIAYLVDFAIGGSLMVTFGFSSAIWAILLAAATIFLTGLPIAYYSAKYNIDMDLRGAGFGYLGSTITSLIYASFTFIFFSLEAVVMAQALTLFTGIPIWVSYIISALMVIPLVVFGMTLLSKFQMWTQPIWFALIALPFIAILVQDPGAYSEQCAVFDLGKDAFLEYLPHHLIPYAGSNFRQVSEFRIDADATLFCWEAFAAGRVVRGERFEYESLSSRTRIFRERMPQVMDGFDLSGVGEPFGGYSYMASFYVLAPADLSPLADELYEALGGAASLASASAPSYGLCAARIFSSRAQELYRSLNACRVVVRSFLDLSPPPREVW
jgi:hypothetical protein